ncbi:MAG: 2-oxo acid dehydrogenase subunit E2 [Pseudomonadales bacterium]
MAEKVLVPDVGEADNIEVVEILVAVGDVVVKDESLVVLESDKASMEIPAPFGGVITAIAINVGDAIEEGGLILELDVSVAGSQEVSDAPKEEQSASQEEAAKQKPDEEIPEVELAASAEKVSAEKVTAAQVAVTEAPRARSERLEAVSEAAKVHAGPAVRKLAREYGVQLTQITGTGKLSRILKEDIQAYVKKRLSADEQGGSGIPPIPKIDFAKFGEIELKPLSRIRKISAKSLHRSWLNIPHVTQFDEADITDLEIFRRQQNAELARDGIKVTPLAFLVKATLSALEKYPQFNSSIDPGYEHLVLKKYYNIGIAVETDDGLVVPVIKNADRMGVIELAQAAGNLAALARDKKLPMDAMQGATFTISSLGGIGGTAFTPIVNAPEVAILGVSRSKVLPRYEGDQLVPRTILPLSLSYDHRAIDGAEAARFINYLSLVLSDLRRMLM